MPTIALPKHRISLARLPTPLTPLDRLSEILGGPRIWVKRDDLTGSLLSGNKVRKLEFTLGKALACGADTLITCGAVQSNHCRATAVAAAQLGLSCHLVLRGDPSCAKTGNHLLDSLVGAHLSYYPQKGFATKLQERLEVLQDKVVADGAHPWIIPTGASDGHGLWGYINATIELKKDFQQASILPKAVVVASGSGGTQAGLTLGFALHGDTVPVIGIAVCDNKNYFNQKVKDDMLDCLAKYPSELGVHRSFIDGLEIHTLDDYIGPGYAQSTPEVLSTIKQLAQLEGIILEPCYTAKAFHGLVDQIQRGRWDCGGDVVFIHTGGIFGLFPYQQEFL